MKLKNKRFITRLLLFIFIGIMFNISLGGIAAALWSAITHNGNINSLLLSLESLKNEPLLAVRGIVFGSQSNSILESGHELYTNLIFQGVVWLVFLFNFYKLIFVKSKRFSKEDASQIGVYGTAHWESEKNIAKRFFESDKGMIVGAVGEKPCIQEIEGDINQMCLVYGGSGSGKTAGYSIPNILHISETLGESFVITDPKADIFNATAAHLRKLGYTIYKVNLLDFLKSDRYNSLDYVTNGPEAISVVNTLMKNSGESKNSDFWEKAERALYAALILYLKETRPKEEQHFASVLKLGLEIGKNPKLLNAMFKALPEDSEAKTFYDIFNIAEEKTRSGILVGFGVRLQLWAMKDIRSLTAASDFQIKELAHKKTAVFVLTRDDDSSFDLLTALFIDQTFQELAKEARKSPKQHLKVPVRMILDEIANIAPINDLEKRMAVMRSRGVRISLIFQGIQQFKNRYGEGVAAEISDSCDSQIILQANDDSTAIPVSKMLGKTTVLTNSVSQNHNERGSSNGMSYSMQGTELMTPDQVRKKDKNKLILFQKGSAPAFIDKYFYYKQKRWSNLPQADWNQEPNREDKPINIASPFVYSVPQPEHIEQQQDEQITEHYEDNGQHFDEEALRHLEEQADHYLEEQAPYDDPQEKQDKKPFDMFS
ncbi:VirD4-like conjugal transfer protein, CD1115 family [Priestia megaterium]|uniref:VirD4-like conjugal transfer protein, CD1115 family n=1 Tax=Priestia megaterium TaxID=1404 RepID=UPI002E22F5FE|nr:type IV secretory system conjugative DNA transfer family protein [Priestia megaterium]MED3861129.1 type IV secretory system conjugative DNA transfer family protein [Priestia megaterium]